MRMCLVLVMQLASAACLFQVVMLHCFSVNISYSFKTTNILRAVVGNVRCIPTSHDFCQHILTSVIVNKRGIFLEVKIKARIKLFRAGCTNLT